MKITFVAILVALTFNSCATTNNQVNVEVEDNDKIAVCGEVDGQKQTYPTMGDLKNDGAKFISYGPCYYQE